MTENSINLNSSVDDVVDFLEEAGLGELKAKFQGDITISFFNTHFPFQEKCLKLYCIQCLKFVQHCQNIASCSS